MAFKICGNQTHLLAQPRGGADKAQNPATGAEPQRSSVHVGLGTNEGDLIFNYVFGRVGIEQPAFLKGNAGVDAGAPSSGDAGGAAATVAAVAVADAASPGAALAAPPAVPAAPPAVPVAPPAFSATPPKPAVVATPPAAPAAAKPAAKVVASLNPPSA